MPLYLCVMHYVCKPSKLWGPQERKDQIGRYEHLKENGIIQNEFGLDNKAFECDQENLTKF